MNEGSNGALEKFGSEDVRLYRRGKFPAQGMDAAYRLVRGEKFSGFKFSAGQISSASDLGFTYGLAVTANADTNNYIRVWRRENEWKIVVDALNPWVRKN
jgi:peptidyl-tRNA hydrolase